MSAVTKKQSVKLHFAELHILLENEKVSKHLLEETTNQPTMFRVSL